MSVLTTFAQSLAQDMGTTTSFEDFDVDINIGDGHDNLSPVDEDGDPTAEASQVEVNEQESLVEEVNSVAEQAEADVETLESIYIALDNSLDNGGLDNISYEMFNISFDSVLRKYGIRSEQVIPSLESFGQDREYQTRVSMERAQGAMSKAWKFTKDVTARIWYEVKKLVNKIVKVFAPAVDKRARKLLERVKDLDKLKDDSKKLHLYNTKLLMSGGKFLKYDDIRKYYENMFNMIKGVHDNGDEVFDSLIAQSAENKDKTYATKLIKNMFGVLPNREDIKRGGHLFELMFGDARLEVRYAEDEGNSKGMLRSISLKREGPDSINAPKDGTNPSKFEVDILKINEMRILLADVLAGASFLTKFERIFNNSTEKNILRVSENFDAAVRLNEKSSYAARYKKANNDKREKMREAEKINNREELNALRSVIRAYGSIASFSTQVSKTIVDYVAQSASMYRKK